jgi:hypothetical protein
MARDFEEVVGFDFSAAFIDAANSMKVRLDRTAPRRARHACMAAKNGAGADASQDSAGGTTHLL